MWAFISDWRVWLWFIALSLFATAAILFLMPPSQSLRPVTEDDDSPTADEPTTDDTEPGTYNRPTDGPPPLPLWRRTGRHNADTAVVRWIKDEIGCAPDDVTIAFKLYAEAAELHSVLVGETMITPIEIYAQFLKAAADWEKKHGETHTFSAEVIWGGETRSWLSFTL